MSRSNIYISYSKGLESLGLSELKLKSSRLNIELGETTIAPGSIRANIHLHELRHLMPFLKTPNRFILELKSFKCRDLPKLFTQIQKVKWGSLLLGDDFKISAYAVRSRIGNEKRIISTAAEGLAEYFKKQNPKKFTEQYTHEIRISFVDDLCTLGLDLTGEHMHKRGGRLAGKAPIRETYAAALFEFWRKLTKLKQHYYLADLMCGSGSLLFEARSFFEPTQRKYSIDFLREFINTKSETPDPIGDSGLLGLWANDIEQKAIQNTTENFKHASSYSDLKLTTTNIDISKQDELAGEKEKFISSAYSDNKKDKGVSTQSPAFVVFSNLPYNERLAFSEKQLSAALESFQLLSPDNLCLLASRKQKASIAKKMQSYKLTKSLDFYNNSIPVFMGFYEKK